MKRVNVTVWSDFVCPWCWIAKRHLERAVAAMAGQVEVVVTPKAYRLAKGMAPQNFKTALYKFGNAITADRMMSAVAENGAMEGLTYNFDTMRFGDTSAAHALVKSIESPAEAQRMIERLYRAATTDGINIFDREMLAALAKEVGVSRTSFDLDSPQLAADIARDELEAGKVGNGVPLFVFNGRFHLSGAREAAVFKKALLDAAIDVPQPFDEEAGATCGIDGCGGERAAAHP